MADVDIDIRDAILRKIAWHSEELSALKRALRELDRNKPVDRGTEATRYAGMRPIAAMRVYLNSVKEPRSEEEIIRELTEGGCFEGKRKKSATFAMESNLERGNIVQDKRTKLISLPEWKK